MSNIKTPLGVGKENVHVAKHYRSRSLIEIHTTSESFGPNHTINPSNNLLSWSFDKKHSAKDPTQEVGSVELVLTAGVTGKNATTTWQDLVPVQSLLIIYASPDLGGKMRTRFVGVITDVNYIEDTASNPQNPTRQVQIVAEDLMAGLNTEILFAAYKLTPVNNDSQTLVDLFNNFQTIATTFAQSLQSGLPMLNILQMLLANQQQSAFGGLSPSQITALIMNQVMPILYAPTFQLRTRQYGGSIVWGNLISQALDNTDQFAGANFYVTPSELTIYNLLASVMNPPFLEFFGDVRSADQLGGVPSISKSGVTFGPDNAQFCMIVRNTPFNTTSGAQGTAFDSFDLLPITDVYLKDVSQKSIGTTTSDVVNYYYVVPETYMQDQQFAATITQLFGAMYDVDSIVKYGMHPMQVSILGFPEFNGSVPSGSSTNVITALQAFNQTLYDWYHQNPEYLRGTVVVHGDPSIRVGQRIRIKTLGIVAYVEQVRDEYVNMASYTTTVTFSRGVYETAPIAAGGTSGTTTTGKYTPTSY